MINDLNTAIDVLIQGCAIGQTKGVYSFQEASYINDAITYINSLMEPENTEENIDNKTEEN